ncbi:hypothetical protein [Streptacidiphilus neutrinimicus]|uniref:hypothetical protein n=1 Tax=Streptacidiphilus neutrinimicus TaxID=105420 RepID=UPI0005AA1DBE|nr:hypothetical protein [Streptacidiphilus neutrinimicus]
MSPLNRTAFAAATPHYWVSAWMGFTHEDQFQTYLWNGSAWNASVPAGLTALVALAAGATIVVFWASKDDRLLRSAD